VLDGDAFTPPATGPLKGGDPTPRNTGDLSSYLSSSHRNQQPLKAPLDLAHRLTPDARLE